MRIPGRDGIDGKGTFGNQVWESSEPKTDKRSSGGGCRNYFGKALMDNGLEWVLL